MPSPIPHFLVVFVEISSQACWICQAHSIEITMRSRPWCEAAAALAQKQRLQAATMGGCNPFSTGGASTENWAAGGHTGGGEMGRDPMNVSEEWVSLPKRSMFPLSLSLFRRDLGSLNVVKLVHRCS